MSEERDAPIYSTFGELFNKGFSLDTTTWVFVLGIHIAAVVLGIWVFAAPGDWGFGGGCLGAGASRHWPPFNDRLFPPTHNPQRNEKVSLPVHLFFCVFGQILSVQGSVRRWSSNHVLHHGVDRHGKKRSIRTVPLGSRMLCATFCGRTPWPIYLTIRCRKNISVPMMLSVMR